MYIRFGIASEISPKSYNDGPVVRGPLWHFCNLFRATEGDRAIRPCDCKTCRSPRESTKHPAPTCRLFIGPLRVSWSRNKPGPG